jgi:hypothetical protein
LFPVYLGIAVEFSFPTQFISYPFRFIHQKMTPLLLNESQGLLTIEVKEDESRIMAKFIGTAANEDAEFLKK